MRPDTCCGSHVILSRDQKPYKDAHCTATGLRVDRKNVFYYKKRLFYKHNNTDFVIPNIHCKAWHYIPGSIGDISDVKRRVWWSRVSRHRGLIKMAPKVWEVLYFPGRRLCTIFREGPFQNYTKYASPRTILDLFS